MRVKRSRKLILYGVFAAQLLLLALAFGRPQIAGLAAPFALMLVVGLSLGRPGLVETALELGRSRVVEGEEVEAEMVVRASADTPYLHLALSIPDGLRLIEGEPRLLLKVAANEERRLPLRFTCDRWGAYRLGDLAWRTGDSAGLRVIDGEARGQAVLRVYPSVERLRSSIKPLETQPFAGNRVARVKGEGMEFADIRGYSPGDRSRHINWRASSVHQTLYVNEQHPERNSDVIVFLDSFAEVRHADGGTLDMAIRGAASLARHYLATRDRVGLVSFGGVVRWLAPSAASMQLYRIVEALLETEVALSFAWRDIGVLPRRSLTPHALVIALTPLLEERGLHVLVDLRRRGFDLVVVEVSPPDPDAGDRSAFDLLATRFWRLERETRRIRLEEMGVAVIEWDGRTPLAGVVEGVRTFRRFARYASG